MKTEILGMVGYMDIVLILMVVLVMFGAKKIPELAKGLGTGIKEFKKAARELEDDPDDLPAREQSAENVSGTDKHEHITAS